MIIVEIALLIGFLVLLATAAYIGFKLGRRPQKQIYVVIEYFPTEICAFTSLTEATRYREKVEHADIFPVILDKK